MRGIGSPDSNVDDYQEAIANLDLKGRDALTSPPRSFRIKPVSEPKYLEGDEDDRGATMQPGAGGSSSGMLSRIPSPGEDDEAAEGEHRAAAAQGEGGAQVERISSTGSDESPYDLEEMMHIPEGFIRLESDDRAAQDSADIPLAKRA